MVIGLFRKKAGRLSLSQSLATLKSRGLVVAAVLDVGVQRETSALIEIFPDAPHLLFEPVRAFDADIAKNYRRIRHQIVAVAVSDADGIGRMEQAKADGKAVSHAWISTKGEEVRLARLDTIVPTYDFKGPYLLKIDVDGAAIPAKIIDGAEGVMKDVSCVVCEMVAERFVDLAGKIEKHGFALWDIVESCYYDDVFYQCDAVFVRKDLIKSHAALRPFEFRSFDPAKWRMMTG